MKKPGETKLAALITIAAVLIFSAFQLSGKRNQFDVAGGMGMSSFWIGILATLIGVIVCIVPQSRKVGQGILIGGGVLVLIGFSLCTGGFGIFS